MHTAAATTRPPYQRVSVIVEYAVTGNGLTIRDRSEPVEIKTRPVASHGSSLM